MSTTSPSPVAATKPLRILCLGASLVAGYSSMGAVYHPFSHQMVKMLSWTLPGTEIEIEVDGVPGDRVTTGTFIERMRKQFQEGQKPFDWTIVLGATNDIAFFIKVDEIMNALEQIWSIPLAHGSKVLAITVPKATIDKDNQRLVGHRDALNQRIKDYRTDGFHVYDLHDDLPYDADHAQLWDDAIHFTEAGYDLIGDRIGLALTGIILRQGGK